MRRIDPIVIAGVVLVLAACSTPSHRLPADPRRASSRAEAILHTLTTRHPGPDTFKGIGRAVIRARGQVRTVRLAWMGSGRDRLRLEIFGVVGYPAVRFADDGQWTTLIYDHPPRFVKKPSSPSGLKRLLPVPVHISDILDLIAGRIPVRPYRSVARVPAEPTAASAADPADPQAPGGVLALKRFWGTVVEKIFFDEATRDVRQVEMYGPDGTLAFRAVFEKMQCIGPYRVPEVLSLSGGGGDTLRLHIERYWPDVELAPDRFVLAPPAAAGSE